MSISSDNRLIFLERKIAFIEDKIKAYENAERPFITTLPITVYDIIPLYKQPYIDKGIYLLVLHIQKKDNRCPNKSKSI